MTTPTTKRNAYHRSILYGVGSTDHRQVLSRNSDSTSTSPRRARESTTPIWTGYIQDAKVPLATREASFLRYPPYVAEDLSGDFTDASAATHRRSPVHHLSHAVETSSHRTPFLIPSIHITGSGATVASVAIARSIHIRYKHRNSDTLLQERHLKDGSYGLQIRN